MPYHTEPYKTLSSIATEIVLQYTTLFLRRITRFCARATFCAKPVLLFHELERAYHERQALLRAKAALVAERALIRRRLWFLKELLTLEGESVNMPYFDVEEAE